MCFVLLFVGLCFVMFFCLFCFVFFFNMKHFQHHSQYSSPLINLPIPVNNFYLRKLIFMTCSTKHREDSRSHSFPCLPLATPTYTFSVFLLPPPFILLLWQRLSQIHLPFPTIHPSPVLSAPITSQSALSFEVSSPLLLIPTQFTQIMPIHL